MTGKNKPKFIFGGKNFASNMHSSAAYGISINPNTERRKPSFSKMSKQSDLVILAMLDHKSETKASIVMSSKADFIPTLQFKQKE